MTIDQALTLAFQFVNQPMADLAIKEMADDLAGYPHEAVLSALKRCRSELKSIRYGDILDRIPGGHPGPEEAWAIMAKAMKNEALTLVWTDEMREAYGVACGVEADPVQARMAFKEKYTQRVSEARAKRVTPTWSVSLGHDIHGREGAVLEAVQKGRLSLAQARKLVPSLPEPDPTILAMVGGITR
jgi:hypothetical protein